MKRKKKESSNSKKWSSFIFTAIVLYIIITEIFLLKNEKV